MAHKQFTGDDGREDFLMAHGIDAELDVGLLRAEDGRWRATCDGNTVWADTPANALEAIAEQLRS